MGVSRHWMKFWPQDWQRDPALRSCGLAARGMWMDLICLAHDAARYGHILINGRAASTKQIASICGTTEREAGKLISELEEAGVFSRTDDGVIFSRRMVRDNLSASEGASSVERRWGSSEASGKTRSARLAEARKKGTHTPIEWQSLLNIFEGVCPRCHHPFEENRGVVRDHIRPIYQGGSDGIDNIQPLCVSCNASKGPDSTDHRPLGWRDKMPNQEGVERLPKRLGYGVMTPTLEAEAEAEAERNPPLPPHRGGAHRANGFFHSRKRAGPETELEAAYREAGVEPGETLDDIRKRVMEAENGNK